MTDAYLPPGTRVRYDGLVEGESSRHSEYGVVVWCWFDDAIRAYDCHVAFFGDRFPCDGPIEKPYVLRYAASSLVVLDDAEN